MKNRIRFFGAGIFGLLTVLLIILVKCADVHAIGPGETYIGLSHINQYAFQSTGVNMIWYNITDWLGIVAIITALLFAAIGLVQMIRRKSLVKVDKNILALGVLYVLVICLYIFFEIVVVNYRPVIMPGSDHPEASFPSSHTMLVSVILGSAMIQINRYVKNKILRNVLVAASALIICVTIVGRLISGVHWFTDIVGGIFISAFLICLYSGVLERIEKNG